MKSSKTIFILVMTIILAKPTVRADESALEIHLQREAVVDTNTIRLGQVGILKGESADRVSAAENICLGVFSTLGQRITIDRQTILGRLAANSIDVSKVSFKGAEQVTAGWGQIISGNEFIKQAIVVLKKTPAYSKAAQYYPVRTPADLVIPSKAGQIKLVPHLSENNTTTLARIEFAVFADGKEIGSREAVVRIRNAQESTAHTQPAAPKVEVVEAGGDCKDTKSAAKAALTGKSSTVINRNQIVSIKIDRGGLQVSAAGKALQKGYAGEKIKVQNIDSNRIIVAKINEDGSVEPVF